MTNIFTPIIVNLNVLAVAQPSQYLRRFCIVSAGESSVPKNTIQMITPDNIGTYVSSDNDTKKWINSFFLNAIGKVCYILEVGSDVSAQQQLQRVDTFISAGTFPCYNFSLPSTLYADSYLGTLLTKYAKAGMGVYFSAVLPAEKPSSGGQYSQWKGQKCFMGYYPSLSNANLNIDGLISGIKASSDFDVSIGTRLSPLEGKYTNTPSIVLPQETQEDIATSNVVFTSAEGTSNVVTNAVYADGNPFSYWYAVDKLKTLLEANFATLKLNASNIPNSALTYNDSGIQTIKQNLTTTLESAINMGLVNQFASSYNLGSGKPVGIGEVEAIPFSTYISTNPEDYKNGFYGGFSAWVQIQRFIRQIQFNVTLG